MRQNGVQYGRYLYDWIFGSNAALYADKYLVVAVTQLISGPYLRMISFHARSD